METIRVRLRSRGGQVLLTSLLVLFVLLCGIHIAGVHHDGDSDALAMASAFGQLGLLALAFGLALRLFAKKPLHITLVGYSVLVLPSRLRVAWPFERKVQQLRC